MLKCVVTFCGGAVSKSIHYKTDQAYTNEGYAKDL